MSSGKYIQKRVGYLGAVQSFRPDTEVLMLATNLLKKDLTSPLLTTVSLPLITLPHIITPSLALSLLPDLLPRLSHSHPAIRKKTIVTLYRLALVYPETLRAAWPKIKERLMDITEDSTVTAATINVVCELGWRRPQDFLPLAPRLFELLVDGGNNWMAIKIIKLFATLAPLEPRLVRKLLPPLTSIIRTTPAMSLLYECINGIIQGGILDGAEASHEGAEVASLCVGKLRGMIMIEGDPNLKYVALLAYKRIVVSHSHLVSMHQDVIMSCIDDPDISIRLQALDLGVAMVNRANITSVVGRLLRQLRNSPVTSAVESLNKHRGLAAVEPSADSDGEDPEESLRPTEKKTNQQPPLPEEYRVNVIRKILDMCSQDTYTNIVEFDWYLDVLIQLAQLVPASSQYFAIKVPSIRHNEAESSSSNTAFLIGSELRNVAVRVKSIRQQATHAAQSLVLVTSKDVNVRSAGNGAHDVLLSAVWVVGEYAAYLENLDDTLDSLLNPSNLALPAAVLSTYLQALPKIFSAVMKSKNFIWDTEHKTMTSLLLARMVHFLDPLAAHPSLEVQERAVELLELMRLAAEAVAGQDKSHQDPPLLVTSIIPSLFKGSELNPVAPVAQKKVPLPNNVDLDAPLHQDLLGLLRTSEMNVTAGTDHEDEFELFYNQSQSRRDDVVAQEENMITREQDPTSINQVAEEFTGDTGTIARRRAERRERYRDDPFYIANEDSSSGTSTPFHNILKNSNGEDVDIDAIPIMDLNLGEQIGSSRSVKDGEPTPKRGKQPKRVDIAADENIDFDEPASLEVAGMAVVCSIDGAVRIKRENGKKSLLQVDSSGLRHFALEATTENEAGGPPQFENRGAEKAEMAEALKEVERMRLEMQRASERVQAGDGIPPDGTLVKRRRKQKKKREEAGSVDPAHEGEPYNQSIPINSSGADEEASTVRPRKTKKKKKEAELIEQ
ncbi:MAG: AP-3 complex subunit delta [Pleopsidium flavum]|nr:MAG: AP-3 complex subunit delta [Pleopsidium flavum]